MAGLVVITSVVITSVVHPNPRTGAVLVTLADGRRYWWNYENRGHWESEASGTWAWVNERKVPEAVRLVAKLELSD